MALLTLPMPDPMVFARVRRIGLYPNQAGLLSAPFAVEFLLYQAG